MTAAARRRVRRSASAAALTGGGLAAAWLVFARVQGDSEVAFTSEKLTPTDDDRELSGHVELVNRGRQMAAVLRVEGRIVDGPPGRVWVTRQGVEPPELGFWVSNLLPPGERCVAEVEVELETGTAAPVVVELDVHEIGRRPVVHRRARFHLPPQDE